MDAYTPDTPIYALATAWAPSALAVVRTSGKGSIGMVASVFSRPEALLKAKGRTLVHGHILDSGGSRIDEVVLSVWREGQGYTGEEAVEITGHGSPAALRRMFRALEAAGFRQAEKGEFTLRAFLSGRMDLTQAEAVEEIVSSKSARSQEMALERLSGALARRAKEMKDRIMAVLAPLEVQLDYAEDEVPEDWELPEGEVKSIIADLRSLASTYRSGRVWREGAKVVLAGPANAGKSSLFNLLAKEERAIVSPVPGTTRDWIEAWVELDGVPVRLFDTAGIREGSSDMIEEEGIRRTEALMEEADLVVYLREPGDTSPLPDCLRGRKTIEAWTKGDLNPVSGALSLSSATGEGVGALVSEMAKALLSDAPSEAGALSIDSSRQRDCLEGAAEALELALSSKDQPLDITALLIQEALSKLALLTGEVTADDILDEIFSNFCLGK